MFVAQDLTAVPVVGSVWLLGFGVMALGASKKIKERRLI
jgi:hypothetical protein